MISTLALILALAGAQEPHLPTGNPAVDAAAPEHAVEGHAAEEEHGFDILHHIQDSREIELPFGGHIDLPPAGSWMVGPIDMTPTKHVVFLVLTALVVLLIFIPAARAARHSRERGMAGKHHNIVEASVLFLRDQVVMPNVGHGGERFAPFIITLFFFILVSNLLGLLPWGATATGNISVTAALALMSFVAIEVAGIRAQGVHYLGTIFYWNKDLAFPIRVILFLIMTPVELLGKLTKPFALAVRLFANMTAGHVLLLAIIGLIFVFGSFAIAIGPVLMAVALTFLELFVAFLQAYIFALLTSVFIGLIQHAH
jgi:F-type H+-transporting ATPase subunit a